MTRRFVGVADMSGDDLDRLAAALALAAAMTGEGVTLQDVRELLLRNGIEDTLQIVDGMLRRLGVPLTVKHPSRPSDGGHEKP